MMSIFGDIVKFLGTADLDKVLTVIAEVKQLINALKDFFDSPNTPNGNSH